MSEPLYFNTPVINAEGNIITLTDLAGGGGGGTNPQLLWTNPDPTAEFRQVTLQDIDLDNFSHILVVMRSSNTATHDPVMTLVEIKEHIADFTEPRTFEVYIKINSTAPAVSNASSKSAYLRRFKAGSLDKQIEIGPGMSTSGTSFVDTGLIPIKIYGIDLSSILS